jgi:hypothetical protein
VDLEIVPSERQKDQVAEIKSKNDEIMLRAIETGNVDALEKLIDLRAKEEARQAQLTFEEEFANMQASFTPIKRTKKNKGTSSNYAPLDELQKHFGPTISKHGFSYRWDEENYEGGKKTTMFISGYGHTKENSFFVPQLEGTRAMNSVQVAASMSTYGQRYTFVAGFGITIEGEDTDASTGPATNGKDPHEEWRREKLEAIRNLQIDDGYRESLERRVEQVKTKADADKLSAEIKDAQSGV